MSPPLLCCSSGQFLVAVSAPGALGEFAREHDAGVWRCMCQLLHIDPAAVDDSVEAAAALPLAAGGLGLRSAERLRHAAHWASWADMLKALSSRIPSVAANLIAALEVERLLHPVSSQFLVASTTLLGLFRGACMGSCGCQFTS